MIQKINIAITNKCNLMCKYCSIWQERPKVDMPARIVQNVLDSREVSKDADFSITGGEPFLHNNFIGIVTLILRKNPSFLKTISTNGTLKDRIMFFLTQFHSCLSKDFALHISFDGINRYQSVRNERKEKIMKNIILFKRIFPRVNIKLKFTITPFNYNDILKTYLYTEENNLGFKIKLVENAKNYTNKVRGEKFYFDDAARRTIVGQLFAIYKKQRRVNIREASFIKNTVRMLLNKKRNTKCSVASDRLFIMPDGKVYSCLYYKPLGNINLLNLHDICNSREAQVLRKKIGSSGCNKCMAYHSFNL